jgi:hypothetical protein
MNKQNVTFNNLKHYNVTFMCCFEVHTSMTDNVKRVKHSVVVPREVQKYMANPVNEILFSFIDPTGALVRLLVMSPLAGSCETKPSVSYTNFAFTY